MADDGFHKILDAQVWDTLFNEGPVCVFMCENVTGTWPVSKITRNIKRLAGWTQEDFLEQGKTLADIIHPLDMVRISEEEEKWKADHNEEIMNLHYRIITRDNQVRHVAEYTQAIKDMDDNITHIVGYLSDVTDQWLARRGREIAEAERNQLQDAVEALDQGFVVWNEDSTLLASNQTFRNQFEGVGFQVGQTKRWELRNKSKTLRSYIGDQLSKHEQSYNLEEIFKASDGKTFRFSSQKTELGHFVEIFSDITSIYQLNSKLEHSEKKFRALAELNADFFWEMDEKLRFTRISDSFLDVTGMDPKRLIGKTRGNADIYGIDPEILEIHLDQLANHEPFQDFVHFRIKEDGEKVWLSVSGKPIYDSTGIFKGYLGAGTDITVQMNRELELKQAKHEAQSADQAKSQFLANMSHELRTPMNGVLGMAELLGTTELDDSQQSFVDVIIKSGGILLSTINDILDFSKLDAKKLKIGSMPFSVSQIVDDTVVLFAPKLAEKDLELFVRIDQALCAKHMGDPERLRQVVTNLISNAVKFTEVGTITINVERVETHGDGEGIRFNVKDTGIGIAPEEQGRIFEKFSQVDDSYTRKHDGSGLGLAIASSLVGLMGGELTVDSTIGEGSTFSFEIELETCESNNPDISPDFSGQRVLVIDGREASSSFIKELIESLGGECVTIQDADGKAALARLSEVGDVSCILLNTRYCEEVLAKLDWTQEQEAVFQGRPVVLMTDYDKLGETRLHWKMDIFGEVVLPIQSKALFKVVQEAILSGSAVDESTQISIQNAMDIGADAKDGAGQQPVKVRAEDQTRQEPEREEEETGLTDPETEDSTRDRIDVLFVEDNEVNLIYFGRVMDKTGYNFKLVKNGDEAIEAYSQHEPSIICMDISMPGKNGIEITKIIRNLEKGKHKHTPIIAVTAFALFHDARKCLDAGMDDYVTKPVSPQKLVERIEYWMDHFNLEKAAEG